MSKPFKHPRLGVSDMSKAWEPEGIEGWPEPPPVQKRPIDPAFVLVLFIATTAAGMAIGALIALIWIVG